MRKIPIWLIYEMQEDPFYKRCCMTGATNVKIEWHHNLIFAGRQVNEKWCILPLSKEMHDMVHLPYNKSYCDWVMLNRATHEELKRYSKAIDLIKRRDYLNTVHGKYQN